MGDLSWLLVLVWLVVGLVILVAAGVLVGSWWLIVWPVVRETRAAVRAGDPWRPWRPREDGTWGPLVENHWWSAFRSEGRGGPVGLAVRWGFWLTQGLLLTVAVGYGLWGLARLAALAVTGG